MSSVGRVVLVVIAVGVLAACEPNRTYPVAVENPRNPTSEAPGTPEDVTPGDAGAVEPGDGAMASTAPDWGLRFPASERSIVSALALDSAGNIIVTLGHTGTLVLDGSTFSAVGCYEHLDGFLTVAKFTPRGELLWLRRPVSPATCIGVDALTVDSADRVWIVAVENATDADGDQTVRKFIMRLSAEGDFESRRELDTTLPLTPVESGPTPRYWILKPIVGGTLALQMDDSGQTVTSFTVDHVWGFAAVLGVSRDGALSIAGARDDAAMKALRVERRSATGDLLWEREFPFVAGALGASRGFVTADAVAMGPDGSTYVIIGIAGTLQLGDHQYRYLGRTGNFVRLLLKLDPSGELKWVRAASRQYADERLAIDSDGNLVTFGSVFDWTRDDVELPSKDALVPTLMRIDSQSGAALASMEVAAYGVTFRPAPLGGLLVGGALGMGEDFDLGGDPAARMTGFLVHLPSVAPGH